MLSSVLERPFARIGARVKVEAPSPRPWGGPVPLGLDVARDARGEHFLVTLPSAPSDADLAVLDVRPEVRHLLLLVRQEGRKDKFLCGFDERHLFTCAVPGFGVTGVVDALQALKPHGVRAAERRAGVGRRDGLRRRNAAFVRQGEWFFMPEPDLVVPPHAVRRHEPISRGRGSKPHRVEELYRSGGEIVFVCPRFPAGLLERDHAQLLAQNPRARGWNWWRSVRGAAVYARGRVSHGDHATVVLPGWHRVLMNTEGEAPAARHVVFLD